MLVNEKLSQEIYEEAGEARIFKAKKYIREGKVNIIKADYEDKDNFSLTARIETPLETFQNRAQHMLSNTFCPP